MGMVTTVFQGNNDELKAAVVTKAQLVQRILDAYAENAEEWLDYFFFPIALRTSHLTVYLLTAAQRLAFVGATWDI